MKNRKILAAIAVILAMLLTFAACGSKDDDSEDTSKKKSGKSDTEQVDDKKDEKDYDSSSTKKGSVNSDMSDKVKKTETVYGVEKPIAYDENGYAVFNEKGLVRIYDVDEKGNIQKDADGNILYNYYDVGGDFIHDNIFDSILWAMKAPKGFTAQDASVYIKNGSDGKCKISIHINKKTETPDDFAAFYETKKTETANDTEQLKGTYEGTVSETFSLGSKNLPAFSVIHKTFQDGKLVAYTAQVYYLINAEIWQADYVCEDMVGYDESFDLAAYMKQNFVTK